MASKEPKEPAEPVVTKKAAAKPDTYVVAPGRALSLFSRVVVEGDTVRPDEVADIEALVRGGYIIKA